MNFEYIDSNDYVVHGELPSGIVDPFDGDEVEEKAATPQPEPVKPANTNGHTQPTNAPKQAKKPQWSTVAWEFFNEVEAATGNYWQGNGWHFAKSMEAMGIDWSLLNDDDKRTNAFAMLTNHARQAKAEPTQDALL